MSLPPRLLFVAVLIAAAAGAPPASAQGLVVEQLSDNPATTNDANSDVLEAIGSENGTRAVFTTTERMLPSDTDSSYDAYARNADGTLTHVSDSAASTTDLEKPVAYISVSADGSRVFFRTAERLV